MVLKLSAYFSIRGYPIELVMKAFLDTNRLTRNEILAEKLNSIKDDTEKKTISNFRLQSQVYLLSKNGY